MPGGLAMMATILSGVAFVRAVSSPHTVFYGETVGFMLLVALVLYAVVLTVGRRCRRLPVRFRPQRLLLGVVGVAVGSALLLDGPFLVRWELSESQFAAVVAQAPPVVTGQDWESFDVPNRIGSINVRGAYSLPGGGVVFPTGMALFDDTGIGYFPDGPPAIEANSFGWFEDPVYSQIDGPWYLWTASW